MAISTEVSKVRAHPELRTRATQVLQQTAQRLPQLNSELQNDRTKMSDELMDEVGKAVQTQGSDNLDALLGAVTQNFVDRKVQEAGPAEEAKNKPKKMDVEWAPEVRAGEIMPPQGYTGQLIFKESKEQPKDEAVQPAGKAGKGANAGAARPGAARPASPSTGANPSSKKANSPSDDQSKSDDTVELTAESQKMAQKMQQGGMKPTGMDSNGNKKGAKAEERIDVLMPAAGVTQLVDVRPGGQLAADGVLGTYRKLDDMPAFNGAILRKRTGKEIVQEHNEKLERGEKVAPLTEEQKQKLMNPVATDK